jgi:hypothetical protein
MRSFAESAGSVIATFMIVTVCALASAGLVGSVKLLIWVIGL